MPLAVLAGNVIRLLKDSCHACHEITGPVTYDGFAWHCAPVAGEPVVIRPVFAWEGDLAAAWARWRAWLAVHPAYAGDAARQTALAAGCGG